MSTVDERPATSRIPNLDGLRAVSIALVFAFHSQILGLHGGFIGVSVFFTLSGFLLTQQLLRSPLNGSTLRRYWRGRLRRIMPAAVTVVVAVVLYEWLRNETPPEAGRRAWMAALGMSNWLQVSGGQSYADLFAAPDKLVHFWSLGVELQSYLLLPLVIFALVRWCVPRRRPAMAAALAGASFALPFIAQLSTARAYYGTDTRVGEILAGAALAFWQHAVPSRDASRRPDAVAVVSFTGVIAVAALVRPADTFVGRGLFPTVAILSTLLIHAVSTSPRALWGILDRALPRRIGELSFAIYLVHWPIIVVLDARFDTRWFVAGAAAVLSVLSAWVLHRVVELPLRSRSVSGPSRRLLVASLVAATALAAFTVTVARPADDVAFLADLERRGKALADAAPRADGSATTTTHDKGVDRGGSSLDVQDRVMVFGDSAALSLALVIRDHIPRDQLNMVGSSTTLGCGIVQEFDPERCATVPAQWDEAIAATPADIAVVMSCQWELLDSDVPGAGKQHVGTPEVDRRIESAYSAAIQLLLDRGFQRVVWVLCPEFSQNIGWPAEADLRRSRDPARVRALDDLARRVVAEFGTQAAVLDLPAWMVGRIDDAELRPDGAHFAFKQRTILADAFPGLLAATLTR